MSIIAFPSSPAPGVIPRRGASVTIAQAIDGLLVAKAAANYRPACVTSLRQYLSLFARGREGWPLEAFTVETIEEWFATRKEPRFAILRSVLLAIFLQNQCLVWQEGGAIAHDVAPDRGW
jgi:hypothetical protein